MTDSRSYGSPGAFRRALTDKLKNLATRSRWTLQQLQRQMAYDRLLERLYLVDEGWIIKGATALLARDIGVRATIDIDVYREAVREIAEADLRRAAALDIGDWFRFEIGPPRPVVDGGGVRLPMTALVGTTVWVQFHVDLVGADLRMTGEPEDAPPLARVVMPDVEQHGYRAYPLGGQRHRMPVFPAGVGHISDLGGVTCDSTGLALHDIPALPRIVTGNLGPM